MPGLARWKGVRHAISTRAANVSLSVGVGYGDALLGRGSLLAEAGIDPRRTVVAGQVHGNRVAFVDASDAGAGALVPGTARADTDGLATTTPEVGLLLTAADCPTVVLFDPEARALAAAHSGWRGTAAEIARVAVETLVEHAGAAAGRMRAAIGPGIGACCYEVGDEVVERVPARLRGEVLRRTRASARPRLDLPRWIGFQLEALGIEPARIETSEHCSSCRTDLFFSHRAEKGSCGRCGFVVALERGGAS